MLRRKISLDDDDFVCIKRYIMTPTSQVSISSPESPVAHDIPFVVWSTYSELFLCVDGHILWGGNEGFDGAPSIGDVFIDSVAGGRGIWVVLIIRVPFPFIRRVKSTDVCKILRGSVINDHWIHSLSCHEPIRHGVRP